MIAGGSLLCFALLSNQQKQQPRSSPCLGECVYFIYPSLSLLQNLFRVIGGEAAGMQEREEVWGLLGWF